MIAIIIALPALGIAMFFFTPPILAIIVTVVGGYLSYSLSKFVRGSLGSRVIPHDEGITFNFGHNDIDRFTWEEVTFVGTCREEKQRPYLFVYDSENDRLVTVPNEYENFDSMIEEIRGHVGEELFEEIILDPGETIAEVLRERLGVDDDDEEEEEEEEEDDTESEEIEMDEGDDEDNEQDVEDDAVEDDKE